MNNSGLRRLFRAERGGENAKKPKGAISIIKKYEELLKEKTEMS